MDFSGTAILVAGDVMLDRYLAGDVARISPEAPVPVVRLEKRWSVPGGAGNVARNLSRLGVAARLVGLVGDDAEGRTLRAAVTAEGIEDALTVSHDRATTSKTRILGHGQQLLRLDEERVAPLGPGELEPLKSAVARLLPGCGAIIISDYGKGVFLRREDGGSLCADIMAQAKVAGIPVLVDPKGKDWSSYAGAACVTPNTAEFLEVCGLPAGARPDAAKRRELAEGLCRQYGFARLLLTRGPRGMILYAPGEEPVRIRAAVREVADVSGAGDTVIAALAACVAGGLGWAESAAVANAAAGVAVGKAGTAPVALAELNEALRQGMDNPKLFALPALRHKLEEWRRRGERIVFTNGCFDLLHPGHISLLRQAAALGDRLVVGLNADASVRRLKGPERPIQNETSRALLLAALQAVDAVVLFGEDTPERLIHEVAPDVLVKGSDYRVENVVGADFVLGRGGEVHLVDLVDGCSTTGLVRKMRPAAAGDTGDGAHA
ncbi:MAG: D-glycero-beta-D-manno-heptose 1-phosphate adenylyltransferase [Desulfovibrio sp.]|uniref:D-glycero-beta-D-manno-heptose 1-phosphate adenylyltransferase n=1 Tax=Desulfovibrio sp. TaxID=885 RepID=UPI001A746682|nr:D-glycero-beta-D-manno-heptose 1-phosphate adenylyltransferase [Desulfovibrio sp.]MBD5417747.1 D-glycero-beta-D-manno-heptose 1-phosphate adenylyltransferase [Desulfovibrio sp.]